MIGGSGGVTEDVVQRWILDPENYKKGIADVAKLIQQQQKHERDLTTVRGELDKATLHTTSTMKSMGDALGKVGLTSGMVGGVIGGLAVAFGQTLLGSIKSSMAQTEKWLRSTDDQIASLRKLSDSVGGVIAPMDIMRARTRMLTGELAITERDLSNVQKASVHLGRALGEDATSAFDRFSQAVQGGKGGKKIMRLLGEDVQFAGDETHKMGQLLEVLERKYGDMSVSAKNAAERSQAFKTEISLAWAEMIVAVKHTDAWRKSMDWLTAAGGRLAEVLRVISGKATQKEFLMVVSTIGAMLPGKAGEALQAAARAQSGISVPKAPDITVTNERGERMGPTFTEDQGLRIYGHAKEAKKGGGGVRDKSSPFGIREWVYDSLSDIEKRAIEMIEEQGKRHRDLMKKNRGEDVEAGGERDRLRLGEEFKKFTEQAGRDKTVGKLKSTFGGGILGDKAAEGARRSVEALEKYRTVVQGLNADMGAFTKGSLADFAGGMWSAADAAIQGGQSFGMAMAQMVKATLLGIAQQSTVKAIFNLAEAAAQWFNPYAVSMHLTAAALYGSIAVVTGAAGLGMSAAMAGGQSKSAGAGASHGSNSYKPSYGSTSSKDKQPLVINVWLGGKNDPAAALYMRQQIQAMAA